MEGRRQTSPYLQPGVSRQSYTRLFAEPPWTPHARSQQEDRLLYGDKFILTIEGNADHNKALEWIAAYNTTAVGYELSVHDELVNALYIIQIIGPDPTTTRSELLRTSPLCVGGKFASVNELVPNFNARNPIYIKQLVMVHIWQGGPYIYSFLEDVLEDVRKVIYSSIASGRENHRIEPLVETSKSSFLTQVTFKHCNGDQQQLIIFDYTGLQLWCNICKDYFHNSIDCPLNNQAVRTSPHHSSSSSRPQARALPPQVLTQQVAMGSGHPTLRLPIKQTTLFFGPLPAGERTQKKARSCPSSSQRGPTWTRGQSRPHAHSTNSSAGREDCQQHIHNQDRGDCRQRSDHNAHLDVAVKNTAPSNPIERRPERISHFDVGPKELSPSNPHVRDHRGNGSAHVTEQVKTKWRRHPWAVLVENTSSLGINTIGDQTGLSPHEREASPVTAQDKLKLQRETTPVTRVGVWCELNQVLLFRGKEVLSELGGKYLCRGTR
ncbi:unnamed protein product [Calypogeia fissa]